MKTIFQLAFIITLFVCSSAAKVIAQDTIIFTDGTVVSCKILQVSTDEVKYKKFDNLDGPDFIKRTSEINMIKYKGGLWNY
ncbi:MAG: hypothetical protein H0W84_05110 [Bacteroidetes bacterium]|nr:hypothetical protein [Bacteroidota bacterium]